MEFVDLKTQQTKIQGKLKESIDKVLSHGQYILGPEIKGLEKALATYTHSKYVLSCASGTDALLLPLMAKGIGLGDAIFTTPFTFIATAEVISLLKATPVFVDVDPQTFNMDPAKLKIAIEDVQAGKVKEANGSILSPKAIISVDLFGLPCDYGAISKIASDYSLWILEDAAQAFGAIYNDKVAPSLTLCGATSFFPAKPLGCYGDGGAIFTDDENLYSIMDSLRVHGKGSDKYDNIRIGINGRMDTLQAAITLCKMDVYAEEFAARQKVADLYSKHLSKLSPKVIPPFIPSNSKSAWAQYSILCESRDELQNHLKAKGIPSMIYYPKPLHLQTAFKYLNYKQGDFEVSEKLSKNILSLPMHPYLSESDQELICNSIKEFYQT